MPRKPSKKHRASRNPHTENEARREYVRSHWGLEGPVDLRKLRVPDPRAEIPVELGQLVSITYRTKKGTDRKLVDYEHEFRNPLPRLCYTSAGLLVAGGGYKVNARGIVG